MRIKSGIEGLDELMEGGFPDRTVNLISGPAGSGKSLFGLQYLHEGAKAYGQAGLYLSLEESRDNILRAAGGYGMDLEALERSGMLRVVDFGEVREGMPGADEKELGIVSFGGLADFLRSQIGTGKYRRLVLDSISAAGLYYSSQDELRRELFAFCRFLKSWDMTSLLITEASGGSMTRFDVEQFVADSIISLGYENVNGEYRRTLTIYKMRFTRHEPYKHPFLITPGGIEVDPDEIIY